MGDQLKTWAVGAKFVVTGGAGFIGSFLTSELLRQGARVTVVDNLSTGQRSSVAAGATLRVGDVCDKNFMDGVMRDSRGCFHLAAMSSVQVCFDDRAGTRRTNRDGTENVMRAASHAGGIPVVFASSAAVYGDCPSIPTLETACLLPISAYGEDKLANELSGANAAYRHGLPNTALRLFNVYGKRQKKEFLNTDVITQFLDRMHADVPLRVFGDGRQLRDFVFVEDVALAFCYSMQQLLAHPQPRFTALNVCNGHGVSMLQLADLLTRMTGKVAQVRFKPARVGDIRYSIGDPKLFNEMLPISERTRFADGLRKLVVEHNLLIAGHRAFEAFRRSE